MKKQTDLTRRSFIASTAAAAVAVGLSKPIAAQSVGLKDAYKGIFEIGTALDFRTATEFNDIETGIIKTHFNAITPENSMKPQSVHPQEDQWNWTQPDALMKFCGENNIKVYGHCLAWHSQTNPWFFQGANRDLSLGRLKAHIGTLLGRYKGKIAGWDVVNEAINDGGGNTATTENLRNSQWHQIVGPDFLTQAFKFAREADPDVPLHYNDYNIESGAKHQSSMLLLKRLISEGAPLNTVGIQGHWGVSNMNAQKYEQIEQAIENYKGLKLKIAITELDLTMSGAGGGQLGPGAGAPGGAGGARGGARGGGAPSPESLQAQAEAYAKLFALFIKHKDAINRVTFWGLNDRRSWRAGQNPLLFDAQNMAKPAVQAIIDVAAKSKAKA